MSDSTSRYSLRAHIKAFRIPPVHDALVIGTSSPIGLNALSKAVQLIIAAPFETLMIEGDDTVSSIMVRASLLKRIPPERLRAYVLEKVKPLMDPDEILHLDLFPEVILEGTL